MGNCITLVVDIPESLYSSLSDFLETESDWDFNQVFIAALLQFLNKRPSSTALASELKILFPPAAAPEFLNLSERGTSDFKIKFGDLSPPSTK